MFFQLFCHIFFKTNCGKGYLWGSWTQFQSVLYVETLHTKMQFSDTRCYVLQFNSILTQCTRRWHQVPQVKGLVPQDCNPPTSDISQFQFQVIYYLCFCPTGYRLEVPTTPSLVVKHQSQAQVVTYISDQLSINQRFSRPLP